MCFTDKHFFHSKTSCTPTGHDRMADSSDVVNYEIRWRCFNQRTIYFVIGE